MGWDCQKKDKWYIYIYAIPSKSCGGQPGDTSSSHSNPGLQQPIVRTNSAEEVGIVWSIESTTWCLLAIKSHTGALLYVFHFQSLAVDRWPIPMFILLECLAYRSDPFWKLIFQAPVEALTWKFLRLWFLWGFQASSGRLVFLAHSQNPDRYTSSHYIYIIPFHTLSYPLNSSHSLERKDTLNTLQSESKNNIEQTLLQSTCHNISSHYPSWMVAPLALWRIPWPSRLNLSYGMPHHLMKHSMHVRVNYINKPLWIQEESSTVNVDFGEQLNKSWNEDNQPDWSYHLTPSPLVHGNMQFTCTSMQPSSRCGAVLVGLALLAIVPKFCFGLKGKAMGVHLVCMLNDFFNSWSSRLIRPVKLNALLTVTVTWLMVPRAQFTTPKI